MPAYTIATAAIMVASWLWLRRRRRLQNPEAAALPPKVVACQLVWESELPCFCHPTIRMDLSVLTPNRETVAAFFGSPDAAALALHDAATGANVDFADLVAGGRYTVKLASGDCDWLPIKSIAGRLDPEAVQRLSSAFYARVWDDADAPTFRNLFVGNAESAAAAANAQWRWLLEMWGGPKRYSEEFGQGTLVTRMLSKHSKARMQYKFCHRWLQHMLAAMQEVGLAEDPMVAQSIKRYWLHFFGFFEMSVEQRQELRALALP